VMAAGKRTPRSQEEKERPRSKRLFGDTAL
jgi:hypothetical protein